ncbi:MAG: hypothetical protein QXH03_00010 [Candidatus Bathyarchaeia archaeon]
MKVRVLIWRGGIRFYQDGDFIFDPRHGDFIGPRPPPREKVTIVDANVFGGHTLFAVAQRLRQMGYEIEGFAGNTLPSSPLREIVSPLEVPKPASPIIFFAGYPGSGKSAVAAMVARMVGAYRIKWASFIEEPGLYGEKAALKEEEDPLFFARKAFPHLCSVPPEIPVVLDGVKDMRVVQFLAYTTSRPAILIFVQAPDWLRHFVCQARQDPDDLFWKERDELFAPRLEEIRRQSLLLQMDSNDHREILELLRLHGIRPRLPLNSVPVLFDKFFALEFILYVTRVIPLAISISDIPDDWIFHHRYVERYPVPEELKKLVCAIATSFRIIDDILDEDMERRIREGGSVKFIPALWAVEGVWVAVAKAMAMLSAAARHPAFDPEMVRRVVRAVWIELEADAGGRPLTPAEYELTLEREAAFREWVARISGYPIEKAREEAIRAQIENDRMAKGLEAKRVEGIYHEV